jgi:hypothetical protein
MIHITMPNHPCIVCHKMIGGSDICGDCAGDPDAVALAAYRRHVSQTKPTDYCPICCVYYTAAEGQQHAHRPSYLREPAADGPAPKE